MSVRVRRHVLTILLDVFVATFFLVAFSIAFLAIYVHGDEYLILQIVVLFAAIVAGSHIIHTYFAWTSFIVEVRPNRITVEEGVLLQHTTTWNLTGNRVEFRQSFFDQQFDIGTLILDDHGEHMEFSHLEDFSQIKHILCR